MAIADHMASDRHHLDRMVQDIVDIYRPLERQMEPKLRELIKDCLRFAGLAAQSTRLLIQELQEELDGRLDRRRRGPSFQVRDVVEISQALPWWPRHIAVEPPQNCKGEVLHYPARVPETLLENYMPEDFEGMVVVQFLTKDLGLTWEVEPGESNHHTTYLLPNWSLEKIQ